MLDVSPVRNAEKVEVKQPPTKTGKPRKPKFEPACSYAAPVNRQGKPMLPEKVDIKCPVEIGRAHV